MDDWPGSFGDGTEIGGVLLHSNQHFRTDGSKVSMSGIGLQNCRGNAKPTDKARAGRPSRVLFFEPGINKYQ